MRSIMNCLQSLGLLLITLLACMAASVIWVPHGGVDGGLLLLEIPLLLLFAAALLGFSKHQDKRQLIAVLVVLLLPLLTYDAYYYTLLRYARFADFNNMSNLALAGGQHFYVAAAFCGLWAACLVYGIWRVCQPVKIFIIALLVVAMFGFGTQGITLKRAQDWLPKWRVWDDKTNNRKYGRLTNMLVAQGQRRENLEALERVTKPKVMPDFYVGKNAVQPNITVLVLESFMDPRLLKDAQFDREPLHPDLLPWLAAGQFDLITAPTYGGGTPQTEFEVLTGAPALGIYGPIEYNLFTGQSAPSMPLDLAESGYSTRVIVAASPRYYNRSRAYPGHGMDNLCFIELCEGFSVSAPYFRMHDEDLLRHVSFTASEHDQPLFSYVLGAYGHADYERHPAVRPDVTQITGPLAQFPALHRISNQFYYRTKGIADYLQREHGAGSTNITLILGDHLPPIINDKVRYQHDIHQNAALLYQGMNRIDINGLHTWQLPSLMVSLANAEQAPDFSAEQAEAYYHYLMKRATRVVGE